MNQFHHASIEKAFSQTVVSVKQLTIEANIGGRKKAWTMSSKSAAKSALETLQRQMFVSFESIDKTCRACNAQANQPTVISNVKALSAA